MPYQMVWLSKVKTVIKLLVRVLTAVAVSIFSNILARLAQKFIPGWFQAVWQLLSKALVVDLNDNYSDSNLHRLDKKRYG